MDSGPSGKDTPFILFTREEWAKLRANTPMTLSEADLVSLRGINEKVSLQTVADIYLPISRLLNLNVTARQQLSQVTSRFLGQPGTRLPYIIALAGSVAVGKSTAARILQALLSRWPDHPRVDLVTTDGFLYPNAILEERNIMHRKGFPESYDLRRLMRFVRDIKSGCAEVVAPVYSHTTYDIVPDRYTVVQQPDILILEGLNVLQRGENLPEGPRVFISDYFDYSLYVDAEEQYVEQWFLDRFQSLRATAFQNESSYFHHYALLSDDEALGRARQIWRKINGINLQENILPTRERASLIVRKGADHEIISVRLRRR